MECIEVYEPEPLGSAVDDSDDLAFAPETDGLEGDADPWVVGVIDDDPAVHDATRFALDGFRFEGRPLKLLRASSAEESRSLFQRHPELAVALVDVVMETEDAGLRLISYVREELKNRTVRLVLRTGQPGVAPQRDVITGYDINDYRAKTELDADRLFSTLVSALRAYSQIRDAEAARDEAARARRAAEASDRTKSAFLTAMSHELRTPIGIIIATLDMALEEDMGPLALDVYGDDLGRARLQATDLLAMIDDILDVANLAGELSLDLDGTVDLAAAAAASVATVRSRAPQATIDTAGLDAATLPCLRGDRRRVEQVLVNLLSNAVKFSPDGGTVTLERGA